MDEWESKEIAQKWAHCCQVREGVFKLSIVDEETQKTTSMTLTTAGIRSLERWIRDQFPSQPTAYKMEGPWLVWHYAINPGWQVGWRSLTREDARWVRECEIEDGWPAGWITVRNERQGRPRRQPSSAEIERVRATEEE